MRTSSSLSLTAPMNIVHISASIGASGSSWRQHASRFSPFASERFGRKQRGPQTKQALPSCRERAPRVCGEALLQQRTELALGDVAKSERDLRASAQVCEQLVRPLHSASVSALCIPGVCGRWLTVTSSAGGIKSHIFSHCILSAFS